MRALGYETVLDVTKRNDARSRNMAPNMTAEETQRMENALEKLSMMRAGLNPNSDIPIKFNTKDENDENFLLDTLQEKKKTPQEQKKLD